MCVSCCLSVSLSICVSLCVCPDVSLSSDFIAGFCSETEADHQLTLDLISRVKYNFVYCFPYSMRQVRRHRCVILLLVAAVTEKKKGAFL